MSVSCPSYADGLSGQQGRGNTGGKTGGGDPEGRKPGGRKSGTTGCTAPPGAFHGG